MIDSEGAADERDGREQPVGVVRKGREDLQRLGGTLALGLVNEPAKVARFVEQRSDRAQGASGRCKVHCEHEIVQIKEQIEAEARSAQKAVAMTHYRGEEPQGRKDPEGYYCKIEKLALPLKTEVASAVPVCAVARLGILYTMLEQKINELNM